MSLVPWLRPYGRQLLLMTLLTLLGAAAATLPPLLIRQILDRALPNRDGSLLLVSSLALGLALAARDGLKIIQGHAGARLGLTVTGQIRRRLWRRVMESSLHFFTKTPRGEILQRLLNDAEVLQGATVSALPRLLYEVAVASVAAALMVRLEPRLALIAISPVLLAAVPGRWVGMKRKALSQQVRDQEAALYQQAQERLEAIRLVKRYTAEEREATRFFQMQVALARLLLRGHLVAQVSAACQDSLVSEFLGRLPQGYQSLVGERGMQLSGGQRQRLEIARALLYDPSVLILDEATSALDGATEAAVMQNLRARFAGRTIILIAHRLSTVAGADRILVLDGGRVAEEGTHAELLVSGGLYASLYAQEDVGVTQQNYGSSSALTSSGI